MGIQLGYIDAEDGLKSTIKTRSFKNTDQIQGDDEQNLPNKEQYEQPIGEVKEQEKEQSKRKMRRGLSEGELQSTEDSELVDQEEDQLQKGKLRVTVIGVKDVAAMDSNGKSDPFIVVKNGTNEFKTKKVKDTLNAEYNETFEFDYDSSTNEDKSIHFELWDYDTIGDNDQIGKLEVPISTIIEDQQFQQIHKFKGVNKLYNQDVGDVELLFDYESEIEPEADPEIVYEYDNEVDDKDKQTLDLVVVDLRNVQLIDGNEYSDPYIKLNLGCYEGETRKKSEQESFDTNEYFSFEFDKNELDERELRLELYDLNENIEIEHIGLVSIPV
ncbi:MAG: hypothetical protein EZS28_033442 [Streblomastix strix]|uniref:C2 domain-containing protein n=1 Tax=Streblomastix strix TaxID=222440 RepID=A0A5J4ULP2_9EUKA|nr:MAG: hypothetical protein EZS28_033442 [Streblomastix strix]